MPRSGCSAFAWGLSQMRDLKFSTHFFVGGGEWAGAKAKFVKVYLLIPCQTKLNPTFLLIFFFRVILHQKCIDPGLQLTVGNW